jgi:hypothetical protein
VGGTRSTVTYQTLAGLQSQRVAPPRGFRHGVLPVATGTFIPASAHLRAVPGYIVPSYFWRYMTDPRDAPNGWFRDFGLPLSKAVTATVTKGQLGPRSVVIHAFQNAILTYDAKNFQPWQVERANVGRDYAATFPQAVRYKDTEPLQTPPSPGRGAPGPLQGRGPARWPG